MPFMENIAEQLKALRRQQGWSQEDLARELGVSFSTVNRWENGKAKPSRLAGNQIARLLGENEINSQSVSAPGNGSKVI